MLLPYRVVAVLSLALFGKCQEQKSYNGWSIIKAHPNAGVQVEYLNSLPEDQEGFELQVWQQGKMNRPFDLLVSPGAKDRLVAKLQELQINYTVTSDNVKRALDAEQRPASTKAAGVRNADWFSKFLPLSEIIDAIQQLANANPNIVQIQTIGQSHLNRSIIMVQVTSNNGRSKPGIWLDGGIHAREWVSSATVLYALNKLVTEYNTSSDIRRFVDGATWYIVPVLNPDGYDYTFTHNRMWRKNRRQNECSQDRCCEGVDLNRNFDHDFGGAGTSPNPCRDIYPGPHAFSEPESQAVRDFITNHTDIKAFLSIHAYSQMWFYPYGNKINSTPPDVDELRSLANRAAQALAAVHGTQYDVGTAAELIYECSGGSDDWAKSKAGIKYTYTLELRPSGKSSRNGFILSPDEIVPTAEETWAGFSVVANEVIKPTPAA